MPPLCQLLAAQPLGRTASWPHSPSRSKFQENCPKISKNPRVYETVDRLKNKMSRNISFSGSWLAKNFDALNSRKYFEKYINLN
jgi:hypothetical protein